MFPQRGCRGPEGRDSPLCQEVPFSPRGGPRQRARDLDAGGQPGAVSPVPEPRSRIRKSHCGGSCQAAPCASTWRLGSCGLLPVTLCSAQLPTASTCFFFQT